MVIGLSSKPHEAGLELFECLKPYNQIVYLNQGDSRVRH